MLMEKYIEMPRLNAVWNHPLYQKYYRENEKIEHDREFCCHQITHLFDVARIAYIKNLEEGLGLEKELIYTAIFAGFLILLIVLLIIMFTPSGKKDKVFRVPDQVCAIANGAFIGAANLKKVIIPSKTFYVGIKCFMDCKQLREVRSEKKIKYIMDTAFINCKKIEKYPRIKGNPKLEGSLYFVPESCRVIKN